MLRIDQSSSHLSILTRLGWHGNSKVSILYVCFETSSVVDVWIVCQVSSICQTRPSLLVSCPGCEISTLQNSLIVIHFHHSIQSTQVTLRRNALGSSFYLIRQWAHEIVSANEQVWFSIFFLERGNFIDFKRIHQCDTSTRNVPSLCRKCTQPIKSLNITRYTSDRQSYD